MYTLYGIANCDTVKKSKKKLENQGIEFKFVDLKKQVPDEKLLKRWKKAFGGEWPINKKGRTYRQLKDEIEALSDKDLPLFISKNTSLIKRPILEQGAKVICFGFDLEVYDGIS